MVLILHLTDSDWVVTFKRYASVCYLQNAHLIHWQRYMQTENKRMEINMPANVTRKQKRTATLRSDNTEIKPKPIKETRKSLLIPISIRQESLFSTNKRNNSLSRR